MGSLGSSRKPRKISGELAVHRVVHKDYLSGGGKMTIEGIDAKISVWSPLARVGFPEDVAGVAALLSGPEAQLHTDQATQVSGGAHMAICLPLVVTRSAVDLEETNLVFVLESVFFPVTSATTSSCGTYMPITV
ncbi:hypothetical protein B0J12DRAFT_424836 [Macrophomina phaseolina]|uniref:Uncharacterized protein n=1 Tax=Macrophomina phaseolina TaxID=35725 RepID=A0ABQ8GJ81_9PEZI|nr:hypothetical protein B0J12DRAFT_424836 [Macrophomina phaseolina]